MEIKGPVDVYTERETEHISTVPKSGEPKTPLVGGHPVH